MDYQAKDFGKLLKNNALTMRRLFQGTDTDCMRVYDRNMEAFPVTVDLWAQWVRITDYSEEGMDDDARDLVMDLASRMLYVPIEKVIYHHRQKRTGREQHDVQEPVSTLVEVREQGLVFTVDLTKRVDTGLFLDHMPTRALVGSMSYGLRVLNLFSYTGSFSVYAARGGAVQVDSVDLSATYTAWAEANLAANGFVGPNYRCINADAFGYVKDALEEKRIYDLIIFDPPSFSNSRKMEHDFDIVRDHVRWLHALSGIVKKGGTIIVSSSLGGFSLDKSALGGYTIEERTQDLLAPGFTRRSGTARTWVLTKERNHAIPAIFRNSRKNTETAQDEAQMEEREMSTEEKNKPEVKEATRGEEAVERTFFSEDDDVWTLVWEEEPKDTAETKKERAPRRDSRRYSSDRPRRDDSRPRRFDDRPRREYDDRPRRYDDRPRREYDDRPRRYDDRPRRDYDDRPRRYDDRPRREYDDRPRRYDDRPRREYDDRPRRYDDRPRREYDDRPRRYDDRPRRDYDDRPRRYDDRPRRDYDDRPRRYDDRPRRGYDDGDNQRRAERAFEDRPKRDERPKRERKAPPKPYGFGAKAPRKAKREE
ncbi:MAG: hypothetical protein GX911_00040, partial [Spirochaetales bacterium]|nr:hypothetical protein [Spirochaetales bacterium]